jgi:large subunit ribosomal protein L24e
LQRKKAAKFDWTIVFRRLHKKGGNEENQKKRQKKTVKIQRGIVGASLDVIKAKRDMNPAARAAERKKAIDSIKEEKKAKQTKKVVVKTHAPKQAFDKKAAKGGFSAKPSANSR